MTKTIEELCAEVDQVKLGDRLEEWRQLLLDNRRAATCADRAKLAMEAYKETEVGVDIELRRAHLTKKVLEGVPIAIHHCDTMLVGRYTQHIRGGNPSLDTCGAYIPVLLKGEGEIAMGSPAVKGMISDDEREVLRECSIYFNGKTLGDILDRQEIEMVGDWAKDLRSTRGILSYSRGGHYPGVCPDWLAILRKGMRGVIAEAEAHIQEFKAKKDTDINKLYFWQASIISCQAVIAYSRRYAALAKAMAAVETDEARKQDLETIAATCEWVPENPPRTFQEALQFMIMVRIGTILECTPQLAETGRLDQYLWPYFEKDVLQDKTLSMANACDMIGHLLTFYGTMHKVNADDWMEFSQTSVMMGSATICGVTRDGKDASNLLSYIVLHEMGMLCIPEPHIAFRWHKNIPHWMMRKAIETNVKTKSGFPQFMNDERIIALWTKEGIPVEECRDWYCQGCANPQLPDRTWYAHSAPGEFFNLALILDMVLHNGVARNGKFLGVETGDPRSFTSIEDVFDAFRKQEEYVAEKHRWLAHSGTPWVVMRRPFMSSVMRCSCMENGRDILFRDPKGYLYESDRAIIDTGDSIMAIKKLVFDDKVLTMDELLHAIDTNFEGERGEEIRQMCLNCPKFGNDIDEVDMICRRVGSLSSSIITKTAKAFAPGDHPSLGQYRSGLSWNYYGGKGVRALPNGRKDAEPLYDGSFSPMGGMDTGGPTVTLNSVIKVGFDESNVAVLNQKFSGTAMKSQESQDKLIALTNTFMENNGSYIQYNLVDADELREAQEHPDEHRDLLVRVGGFSAYFVTLTKEVQDDIISRTEQTI